MGLIQITRQTVRGCTNLPHVGEHPGTGTLVLFALITGLMAAEHGGWRGFLGGSGFMLLVYGPLYLNGAYDRAQTSDRIATNNNHSPCTATA